VFTPIDVRRIAKNEQSIHSPDLQDGNWEIDMTLANYKEEINNLFNLPEKLKTLIQSEVILLEEARKIHTIKPMTTFVFIAE
jgi:hypothetical protein